MAHRYTTCSPWGQSVTNFQQPRRRTSETHPRSAKDYFGTPNYWLSGAHSYIVGTIQKCYLRKIVYVHQICRHFCFYSLLPSRPGAAVPHNRTDHGQRKACYPPPTLMCRTAATTCWPAPTFLRTVTLSPLRRRIHRFHTAQKTKICHTSCIINK